MARWVRGGVTQEMELDETGWIGQAQITSEESSRSVSQSSTMHQCIPYLIDDRYSLYAF